MSDTPYVVVVNDEEQYSLWERSAPLPAGWAADGFAGAFGGTREQCLAHIEEIWTDLRPRSLRAAVGGP